ncbi:hypothetical protein OE88DRAFT_1646239 [Heliocybe sulcata]|uniref:F-box domain-containing protein n=1 Tax=Heliocybe sulcata TaxID=5364 RepID=A0A5C3MY36_9AGAM|nr:hypothetical protein OE88DRAFT_1646239 [Heliocybe sulcata]
MYLSNLPAELPSSVLKTYIISAIPTISWGPPPHSSGPYECMNLEAVSRKFKDVLRNNQSGFIWNNVGICGTGSCPRLRKVSRYRYFRRLTPNRVAQHDDVKSGSPSVMALDNLEVMNLSRAGGQLHEDEEKLLIRFSVPNIQKLELVPFTWSTIEPLLKGDIDSLVLRGKAIIPTVALLQALGRMEKLRVLGIKYRMEPATDKNLADICLSSVQSIKMWVSERADVTYFDVVAAAKYHNLSIAVGIKDDATLQTVPNLLYCMTTHIAEERLLRTAAIYIKSPKPLRIILSENWCSPLEQEAIQPVDGLAIFDPVLGCAVQRVVSAFISDGESDEDEAAREWNRLFSQRHGLTKLRVHGQGASAMLSGLTHRPVESAHSLVFSRLKKIYVEGIRLSASEEGEDKFLESFKRLLAHRDIMPMQKNLMIRKAVHFYRKDLDVLKSLGIDLNWDEINCSL